MKQTFVIAYNQLNKFYVELARRLVDRDLLEENREIYFLTAEEIRKVNNGWLKSGKIKELVSARKKERETKRKMNFQKIIEASTSLRKEVIPEEKKESKPAVVLKGIGCSIGQATGKARVVLDPVSCGKFEEGDILVAPFTSPSWTPLFLIAGAVITELGGVSSHGSVVAREYGIPCVANVKNATKIIKNGAILTVDGEKGIICIGYS